MAVAEGRMGRAMKMCQCPFHEDVSVARQQYLWMPLVLALGPGLTIDRPIPHQKFIAVIFLFVFSTEGVSFSGLLVGLSKTKGLVRSGG